jgi:putative transcriptional regulator
MIQSPAPAQIRAARGELSQTAAAALVHAKLRTWQQWEAGDRRMHPAFWELFQLKSI